MDEVLDLGDGVSMPESWPQVALQPACLVEEIEPAAPVLQPRSESISTPGKVWVIFSIRGLHISGGEEPSLSSSSSSKRVMASLLSKTFKKSSESRFRDAVVRTEISLPCVDSHSAPIIDETHPLSKWRSETVAQVGEAWTGDLSFRVAALLENSNENRVLRVRLEAKMDGEGERGLPYASTGASSRVVGVASFSTCELIPGRELEVPLSSSTASCLARVYGQEPQSYEVVLQATADPMAPRLEQALALGKSKSLAVEACVEPRGIHEVVRGAIQPVADAMLESAAAWLRRSEAARAEAALFDDDAEARKHGARRVRLGLLGARGLRRRARASNSGSGGRSLTAPTPQSLKKTWSAAVGLAKRFRDGDAPRFGVDDGGDIAPPSCYAVAELRSARRPTVEELGRTNTEYATESPAFGTNSRADSSCPHAKPQLDFALSTASLESTAKRRPIARLRSAQDCGDAAGVAPHFEFYARRDETRDGQAAYIIVKLYDERYSVTRGVEPVLLGETSLPLEPPSRERQLPVWLPVNRCEEDDTSAPPEILVSLEVTSLDGDDEALYDAAFEREAALRLERASADAALLHSWLAFAGIKVDQAVAELAVADEARGKSELAKAALAGDFASTVATVSVSSGDPEHDEAALQLHDCTWLETHAKALARNGEQLAKFAAEAASASTVRSSAFKSSMLKAELDVAATPTNLHVHVFAHDEDRLWTAATSGAPTAAGPLGAQRGGLLRLEAELVELAASIKRRRAELASLPKAVGSRKAAAELGAAARAWEARAAACGVRKTLCRAHALAIAVASVRAACCRAACGAREHSQSIVEGWKRCGLPVVFEALVSTAGNELAMLEDAKAAVSSLAHSTISLAPYVDQTTGSDDHAGVRVDPAAQAGRFVVVLRMPYALYAALGQATFELVPVLFSQGLDARQSIANRRAAFEGAKLNYSRSGDKKASTPLDDEDASLGELPDDEELSEPSVLESATGLQRLLNAEALDSLTQYSRALRETDAALAPLRLAVDKERHAAAEGNKPLEKHWLVLVEAERAVRALDAALCVFCKSGKDRTGMIVTLHNALFFRRPNDPPNPPAELAVNDDAVLARANLLREFGVRLRLCEKNTGRRKVRSVLCIACAGLTLYFQSQFAFNVIQRKFLPPPLRPPLSVIEDLVSSAINRDTS